MNDAVKKIHAASMTILEKTGMRFQHPEVIDLLKEKGIRVEGETAFFTEDQLMHWVKKAPESFKVYARNSAYDVVLGGDNMEVAAGYGSPYMVDRDGTKRKGCLEDYITFLKLVQESELFNVNGGILVEPSDVDSRFNASVMLYNTMAHSDKVLIGLEGNETQMTHLMEMLKIAFGGAEAIIEKPRMMTIVNTLSPLQMDRNALDTLLAYARNGQPVFVTPAAMAGFTSPITLAGMIAMGNAETLAGIALTQMVREGVPVVYGNQCTSADMGTGGFVVGSPEHALSIACAAQMAKSYGLPCRSGGGSSDAMNLCAQTGYEGMMLLSTCSRENVNIVLLAAGALDSVKSMSFDKFMVDLEMISMVKRIRQGITVDEDTLALDLISEIGPGGEFMTSMHTLKRCRKEIWNPEISVRKHADGVSAQEALLARIDKKRDAMLHGYQRPELAPEVNEALKGYLASQGVSPEWLCG